ncbi:MAG: glycoside hydrolase family 16 protein [Paludibacteraceae bacterium]|nr:glycoside hydrolase family 16 protein [Paludibacteraceae bacterium]
MKKLLFILVVASLCSCAKPEWELVWSDEFEGTELNAAYWNIEDNARGGGNAELQYYSPNNVSIEKHPVSGENCLVLTARREDYRNRPCTSARLNTQDKVTVEYGKIEARIAFPYTADGLWPAFWMLGNNLATNLGDNDDVDQQVAELAKEGRVVWPKCGEIDICEMGHKNGIEAGTQDRYFNGACHWGESFNNGAYPNVGQFHTWGYPVQGDFHLFTLIWTEDSIAMYLDLDKRQKTASLKEESIFPDAAPYFQLSLRGKDINEPGHYFNHPFYLVLNLSVGGFFPDMPAAEKYPEVITADDPSFQRVTALPADGTPVKMYVDYIRVYRPLR